MAYELCTTGEIGVESLISRCNTDPRQLVHLNAASAVGSKGKSPLL